MLFVPAGIRDIMRTTDHNSTKSVGATNDFDGAQKEQRSKYGEVL